MNIEITRENGNTTLIPDSRLDSTTADEFSETLQKEIPGVANSLTIDFKNVDFISSIGLRVLVAAYKQLGDKQFIIANANSSVKEIIKLSGLSNIFVIQ